MFPLLLGSLLSAEAHEPGLSRVTVEDGALVLQVARVDAADPAALLQGTTASVGGQACTLGEPDVRPDDNGFVAKASLDCPPGDEVVVAAGWFDQLAPGHRTVVDKDGAPAGFLDASHPSFEVAAVHSAGQVAWEYLLLGVEHILMGWDHLVFLLGLLVVARSLRDIASVVTGFTLAHSITLSLAALGLVTVPASVVEPAIALSIVWVGLENLFDPPARRRFLLTLGLGLVHGLGFAGVLGDIGFPAGKVPLALAMFNVGVEVGQFAVVLVALPLLGTLRQARWWGRYGLVSTSLVVAALGMFWLVTRVMGLGA
jgi:hydrogenase/urease accessory protein HupE